MAVPEDEPVDRSQQISQQWQPALELDGIGNPAGRPAPINLPGMAPQPVGQGTGLIYKPTLAINSLEKEAVPIDGNDSEKQGPAGKKSPACWPLRDCPVRPFGGGGHTNERAQLLIDSLHGKKPGNLHGGDFKSARDLKLHQYPP